ncbi:MAG: triacylglycerol lipase [Chthoniobacter sp.]|jgi:triacylglycerol lipase|nr:triacylglycerol lipase [Chthoniobacter sp.]
MTYTLKRARHGQPGSLSLCLRAVLWMAALLLAHASLFGGEPRVNVVLVHGILDTGKIFDPMVRRLEAAGFRTFAPSLSPNSGKSGLADLARQLARRIDAHFGRSQPILMIGFSMGGLVIRYYVQNLAGRGRVRGVFLISTPNHGTLWALFAPWQGMRELCPSSVFLRTLNADRAAWAKIPVASYWTPLDLMIVPANSSKWEIGETTRILCPLHPLMPRNRAVTADILARAISSSTRPPCAAASQFTR